MSFRALDRSRTMETEFGPKANEKRTKSKFLQPVGSVSLYVILIC